MTVDLVRQEHRLKIEVKNNNIERALKKLKRSLTDEGLFKELQLRKSYEKPSQKRRRLMQAAVRREQKRVQKREINDRAGMPS